MAPVQASVCGLAFNFSLGLALASCNYGTCPCAQLVADSYMHKGLLAMDTYPPNGYSPAAFGMALPNPRLPLLEPATLGDIVFVTWDAPTA